ncbi:glycosyl hydrolase family 18 protein [Hahella ganghwensis]|uniref:glycosyl hydrolase family 18 protein n=1 Tax=Hahella ganghwensis TaxID=286420 RepID=UPI00039D494B|nr:glycosyl hydrolase family 18 protein [Hahella ganghwensis]
MFTNLRHSKSGMMKSALCAGLIAASQIAWGVDCSQVSGPWQEGDTFTAGQYVTYNAGIYEALTTHTAYPGTGWTPEVGSLWRYEEPDHCSGGDNGGDDGGDNGGDDGDNGGDDGNTGDLTGTKFVPYFYSWSLQNSSYWLNDISQMPANVDHVLMAFALAYGDEIKLQSDDANELTRQINAARQKGVKVGVSTGGATAGYLTDMPGTAQEVATKFVNFIQDNHFDFIDVDFEGSYTENPAAVDKMVAIMAEVRKQLPNHDITLTVPSYGGEYGLSDSVIGMAKKMYQADALTAVTAMSFDYYSLNRDVYQAAKVSVGMIAKEITGECSEPVARDCASGFDNFPKARNMYGIISMIGMADDSHVTSIEEQKNQATFARENGLYSIGFWAISRDQGQNCNGGLDLCSGIDSPAGAFTQATLEGLNATDGNDNGGDTGGDDGGDTGGDNGDTGGDTGGDNGDNGGDTGGDSGGDSGDCDTTAPEWSASETYTQGMQVYYDGAIYSAKWWTKGNVPGSSQWGPWELVDDSGCPGDGGDDGGDNGGDDNGNDDDVDTTGWPKPLYENNKPYENTTGSVVGTYFVEWGVYGRNFPVEKIPARNLTHLLYAFIAVCGPNESLRIANPQGHSVLMNECSDQQDYTVTIHDRFAALEKSYPGDKWDDPIRGNFGQLRRLKKTHPDITILPSIGGWTLSDPFHYFANDPQKRAVFVDSVIDFLKTYKFFDGVDIDWEYPGGGGANPDLGLPQDRDGYAELMHDLRAALDTLEAETGREYQLTSAVGAAPSKIDSVNYSNAVQYMDYIFAMTYDYYGAWNNELGHQTGIYPADHEIHEGFSAEATLDNLMAAGVPANKLVIGAAMYGRGWKGVSGGTETDPFVGTGGGKHAGTWEDGVLDYRAIEQNMLGGANGQGVNGYKYFYDESAEAPYLWNYSNGSLITFDNARSVKAKGQYVRNNGFAGIFSWEIDADNGNILNAIHEGLGHPQQ